MLPKRVDHEQKRRVLLQGAFERFAAQGYNAVTMRSVAQDLGVSTGTLYHYFPGKEALFRALVTQRVTADVEEATDGFTPSTTPTEKLSALAQFIGRNPRRLRETLRISLDYAQQHPGDPLVLDVLEGYRKPLTDALGQKGGDLALSMILGALVQQMLAGSADIAGHLMALNALAS